MKKFLMGAAVAATLCSVAIGAVGCGEEVKTYAGSYTYEDVYSEATPKTKYGVEVVVSVKGDKIVSVTVADDTSNRYNYTPIWQENMTTGDLGAEKAKKAVPGYLKVFAGKKVADVKKLTVATLSDGTPDKSKKAEWNGFVLTGATQTSGRILLAVQDALKDVQS